MSDVGDNEEVKLREPLKTTKSVLASKTNYIMGMADIINNSNDGAVVNGGNPGGAIVNSSNLLAQQQL